MKKKIEEPMRPEYKRADFSVLEKGKFHKEVSAGTAVILLEPEIARAFPTSRDVNKALAGLLKPVGKTARNNRKPAR